jgi:hypothetical protein
LKENKNNPHTLRRIADTGSRYIDFKMGLAGAVVMASIVFWVNYHGTQDLMGASTAALKQGCYTLLFGGIIMRGCELLSTKIANPVAAIAAAIIIPSVVAISLTLIVHNLKGTPRPVASTVPTALLIIPSTAVWGFLKRNSQARSRRLQKGNTSREQKELST